MRRVVVFIAIAAAVAVLAAVLFVDWRFLYRWSTLPEDPGQWPARCYQAFW